MEWVSVDWCALWLFLNLLHVQHGTFLVLTFLVQSVFTVFPPYSASMAGIGGGVTSGVWPSEKKGTLGQRRMEEACDYPHPCSHLNILILLEMPMHVCYLSPWRGSRWLQKHLRCVSAMLWESWQNESERAWNWNHQLCLFLHTQHLTPAKRRHQFAGK